MQRSNIPRPKRAISSIPVPVKRSVSDLELKPRSKLASSFETFPRCKEKRQKEIFLDSKPIKTAENVSLSMGKQVKRIPSDSTCVKTSRNVTQSSRKQQKRIDLDPKPIKTSENIEKSSKGLDFKQTLSKNEVKVSYKLKNHQKQNQVWNSKLPNKLKRANSLSTVKNIKPIDAQSNRKPPEKKFKAKSAPKIKSVTSKPRKEIVKSASLKFVQKAPPSISALSQAKKVDRNSKSQLVLKVQSMHLEPKAHDSIPQPMKTKSTKEAQSINSEVIENVEIIPVTKQVVKNKLNLGENDAEFKSSGFFKSLILSGRELSPGIMKLCSDGMFSMSGDKIGTPIKRSLANFSSENFVEDLKRNSARFFGRKGRLINSPHSVHNSPFAKMRESLSVKENMDLNMANEVKKLNHKLFERPVSHIDICSNRRLTSGIQNNLNLEYMNVDQIAAEIRRLSEMRRESLFQQQSKLNIRSPFKQANFNSLHQAAKNVDVLLSKRKERAKKKVTFKVPSAKNSPDLAPAAKDFKNNFDVVPNNENFKEKTTPNLNMHLLKSKLENVEINNEDSIQNSTPELNLYSIKPLPDLNEFKTNRQSATPELDLKNGTFEQPSDIPSPPIILSNPPVDNCVIHKQSLPETEPCDNFENIVCISISPVPSHSSPITESLKQLKITASLSPPKPTKISVTNRHTIFTPQPVSLFKNSYKRDSISPQFLTGKSEAICSFAPITTPFVLKNMAKISENSLSSICQRLNFEEELKLSSERRESQVVLQNIPTYSKMQDCLCDQECNILSMQSTTTDVSIRPLSNPVASILSYGDEMHFVPVSSP